MSLLLAQAKSFEVILGSLFYTLRPIHQELLLTLPLEYTQNLPLLTTVNALI